MKQSKESRMAVRYVSVFVLLTLASALNAMPGWAQAFSINDPAAVNEGQNVTFTVQRGTDAGLATEARTVDYTASSGSALVPGDAAAVSGTLTFAPGQASRTISVPTTLDAYSEPEEKFSVTLSAPSAGTIAKSTGDGAIASHAPVITAFGEVSSTDYDDNPKTGSPGNSQGRANGGNQAASILRITGRNLLRQTGNNLPVVTIGGHAVLPTIIDNDPDSQVLEVTVPAAIAVGTHSIVVKVDDREGTMGGFIVPEVVPATLSVEIGLKADWEGRFFDPGTNPVTLTLVYATQAGIKLPPLSSVPVKVTAASGIGSSILPSATSFGPAGDAQPAVFNGEIVFPVPTDPFLPTSAELSTPSLVYMGNDSAQGNNHVQLSATTETVGVTAYYAGRAAPASADNRIERLDPHRAHVYDAVTQTPGERPKTLESDEKTGRTTQFKVSLYPGDNSQPSPFVNPPFYPSKIRKYNGSTSSDPDGYSGAYVVPDSIPGSPVFVTVRVTGSPGNSSGGDEALIWTEAQPIPAKEQVLVFSADVTPDSLLHYAKDQTVYVQGADDAAYDGDQEYQIEIVHIDSRDLEYMNLGVSPAQLTGVGQRTIMVNIDDEAATVPDLPGVIITPDTSVSSPLQTSENQDTAKFYVRLSSEPSDDVRIYFRSNRPDEGVVQSPVPGGDGWSVLTFTPSNYSENQEVTIAGVDDNPAVKDGAQSYRIITELESNDPDYGGENPADRGDGIDPKDVYAVNNDNEVPGVTVSPTLRAIIEGSSTNFTVVLNQAPSEEVYINVASSNTSLATVSQDRLTFTPANWNVAQTVTVDTVSDASSNLDAQVVIGLSNAVSGDPNYDGINVPDVTVKILNDPVPGFTIQPVTGLLTNEAGGEATFSVRLNTLPSANVTLPLSTDNPAEGRLVDPQTNGLLDTLDLEFTPANWNIAQIVKIRGIDDNVADGQKPYLIVTGNVNSTDANYGAITGTAIADVSAINQDNEVAGISVTPSTGLVTNENGLQATFTVKLFTKPTADVTVALTSSDPGEGTVAPPTLTFTPANYLVGQQVTVTGVDDAVVDGNVAYQIITEATSADPAYNGVNVPDVSLVNNDNEKLTITLSPLALNVLEGNNGVLTSQAFNLSLSQTSATPVTVAVKTVNDTATGNQDYLTLNSTVTFEPGQTSKQVTVSIVGDNTSEDDETFTVELSSPTGGAVLDPDASVATVTITDDDLGVGTSSLDLDVDGSSGAPDPGYQATWNQAGQTVLADTDATVGNTADTIQAIKVTINNRLDGVNEVLDTTVAAPLTKSFDAATGVLTITGPGTPAQFIPALRSVRYTNNAAVINGSARTFTFEVVGGTNVMTATTTISSIGGGAGTSTIDLDADDSSGAADPDYQTLWDQEGQTVVADTDATLDNTVGTIQSVKVTINNRLDGVNEVLDATVAAPLTKSFNSATGVLTITGPGTPAQFIPALRSVHYTNNAAVINGTTRTFTFEVVGGTNVATATTTISTTIGGGGQGTSTLDLDVDGSSGAPDPGYQATWNQAGQTVLADTDATVGNTADTIQSIKVTINNRLDGVNEVLDATVAAPLTKSFDSATGILTITGPGTPAQFIPALRSVHYTNNAAVINGSTRTFTFEVVGGTNVVTATTTISSIGGGAGTSTIDLDADNSSGAVDPDYQTLWDQEGQTVVADTDATLDNTVGTIQSVKVTINNRLDGVNEVLDATVAAPLTKSFNSATGVLTITGPGTPAQFIPALRSVHYTNNAAVINGTTRTFTFEVVGGTNVATATTTINATAGGGDAGNTTLDLDADDSTGAVGSNYQGAWDQAAQTLIVDTDAKVANDAAPLGNGTLRRITVEILDRQDDINEVLTATGSANVSISYNVANGILTLQGTSNGRATAAEFQNALRTVKYKNNAPVINGTSRTFLFTAEGGTAAATAQSSISTAPAGGAGNTSLDLDADDSSDDLDPGNLPPNGYLAIWDQAATTNLVDSDATVSNTEGTLTKITVTITNRQDDLNEVLSATGIANVSASYDAPSGILTLLGLNNGRATSAEFQNVLRSVKYKNNLAVPNGTSRTFEFRAFGGVAEVTAQTIISTSFDAGPGVGVSTVDLDADDSSGATGSDYQGLWDQAALNRIVDTDAKVTNLVPPLNTPGTLTKVTVTILDAQDDISEVLSATAIANVSVTYDAPTGVLTLQGTNSGAASAAEFQNVLRSVRYKNNAVTPTGTQRSFEVRIFGGTNEPTALSTISTGVIVNPGGISQIDLNGSNDAGVNVTRKWQFGVDNALPDGDALVANSSNAIQKITITITDRQDGLSEVLSAMPAGAVTVNYDAPNGILTLQGPATPAEFQNVVRSVTYKNLLETPTGTSRHFTFEVFGGVEDPRASAVATLSRNVTGSDGSDVDTDGDGIPDNLDDDDDGDGIPDDQDTDTPGGGNSGDDDNSMGGYASRLDLNGAAAGYNYTAKWERGTPVKLTADDALIQDTDDEIDRLVVTIVSGGLDVGESIQAATTAGLTQTTASGILTLQGPASRATFEAALRSIVYTNTDPSGKSRRFRFDLYGNVTDTTVDEVTSVAYTTIDIDDSGNGNNKLFNGSASVSGNTATITYRIRNITGAVLNNILITGNMAGGRPINDHVTITSVTPNNSSVSSRWNSPPSLQSMLDPNKAGKGVRWLIPSLPHGAEATLVISVPLRGDGYGDKLTTKWQADFAGQARNEAVDSLRVP